METKVTVNIGVILYKNVKVNLQESKPEKIVSVKSSQLGTGIHKNALFVQSLFMPTYLLELDLYT